MKPHVFDVLCKALVLHVDVFEPDNYAIIYAILKVGVFFISSSATWIAA